MASPDPRRASVLRRAVVFVFFKIAEPRVLRLVQFGIYVTLCVIGGVFLSDPPRNFEGVLGLYLALGFGGLIFGGGLIGALAVLPGVWWAERLGIIALWTGLSIFIVVAVALQASSVGIGVAWALILALLIRWLQVREYQLAPGR